MVEQEAQQKPHVSARLRLLVTSFGAFLVGLVVSALVFTWQDESRAANNYRSGFDDGFIAARNASAGVHREQSTISLLAADTLTESLEVELKSISAQTNAIEFIYGEIGRERFRVPALNVGDAVARELGNTLYIIKNLSVAANLQRATLEVIRIRL